MYLLRFYKTILKITESDAILIETVLKLIRPQLKLSNT